MAEPRAARLERRLAVPVFAAALLTVPAIALEQSALTPPWDTLAMALNWLIWSVFCCEMLLLLWAAEDRRAWLRAHPLEVAIVVLTPPFLPASLQAARVFRLLRVLRVLRLGVLTRRLLSTEGVRDAAVLAGVAVLGGGAAFAAIEKTDTQGHALSAWDGVWWAITTVTTVGYGDVAPRTVAGRAIAIVVMLVGIGFVAILTAAAAERFLRAQRTDRDDLVAIQQRLDEIMERLERIEANRR